MIAVEEKLIMTIEDLKEILKLSDDVLIIEIPEIIKAEFAAAVH